MNSVLISKNLLCAAFLLMPLAEQPFVLELHHHKHPETEQRTKSIVGKNICYICFVQILIPVIP
jgi:hypothetical protein